MKMSKKNRNNKNKNLKKKRIRKFIKKNSDVDILESFSNADVGITDFYRNSEKDDLESYDEPESEQFLDTKEEEIPDVQFQVTGSFLRLF